MAVGGGPGESDPIIIFYDSVRITSMKIFYLHLVIADFDRMPFGCSVWAAFWSVSDRESVSRWAPTVNWPNDGEVNIVEGVNNKVG